jgi:hypothetical protein
LTEQSLAVDALAAGLLDYVVIIEKAGDGSYAACVPDLPACVCCGESTCKGSVPFLDLLFGGD